MARKKPAPAAVPTIPTIKKLIDDHHLAPLNPIAIVDYVDTPPGPPLSTTTKSMLAMIQQQYKEQRNVIYGNMNRRYEFDDYDYGYGSNGYGYGDRRQRERDEKIQKMRMALDIIVHACTEMKAKGSYSSEAAELPGFVQNIFHVAMDIEPKYRRMSSEADRLMGQNEEFRRMLASFVEGPTVVTLHNKDPEHVSRAENWCSNHQCKMIKDGGKYHFVFADQKTSATFKLMFG